MQRITIAHLHAVIERINRATGSPAESYVKGDDGHYHAQPGNYHLSGAYGGYSLHRMSNESGGIRDVFSCGHVSARQLSDLISAYLRGLEDARRA